MAQRRQEPQPTVRIGSIRLDVRAPEPAPAQPAAPARSDRHRGRCRCAGSMCGPGEPPCRSAATRNAIGAIDLLLRDQLVDRTSVGTVDIGRVEQAAGSDGAQVQSVPLSSRCRRPAAQLSARPRSADTGVAGAALSAHRVRRRARQRFVRRPHPARRRHAGARGNQFPAPDGRRPRRQPGAAEDHVRRRRRRAPVEGHAGQRGALSRLRRVPGPSGADRAERAAVLCAARALRRPAGRRGRRGDPKPGPGDRCGHPDAVRRRRDADTERARLRRRESVRLSGRHLLPGRRRAGGRGTSAGAGRRPRFRRAATR